MQVTRKVTQMKGIDKKPITYSYDSETNIVLLEEGYKYQITYVSNNQVTRESLEIKANAVQ